MTVAIELLVVTYGVAAFAYALSRITGIALLFAR